MTIRKSAQKYFEVDLSLIENSGFECPEYLIENLIPRSLNCMLLRK